MRPALRFKAHKHAYDVASHLAHGLWNELTSIAGFDLNPHIFVGFERVVHRALTAHVTSDPLDGDPAHWTAWVRCGQNGVRHAADACSSVAVHQERLLSESKEAIDLLMDELESTVFAYIAARGGYLRMTPVQRQKIGQTVRGAALPMLADALSGSCCP